VIRDKQHAIVDASGSVSFSPTLTPIRQAVRGSTPTGSIEIGTPPVAVEMIFDTGSDKLVAKTWDTVKRELQMVDGSIGNEVMPTDKIYNHNSSSTYTAEFTSRNGRRLPKRSQITYGSGVAITEDGHDTVTVGTRTLINFPVSEIMADSLTILHSSGFPISIPGSALVMKVKLPPLAPFNKSHSFIQESAAFNLSSSSHWASLVETIPEAYRLDFREVLEASPLDKLKLLLRGGTFCVPALVALDKQTTKGPLWVIGTPLFERYYSRWTWPSKASSPTIFLKELNTAASCQQGSAPDERSTTILNAEASARGQNLMRTEQHAHNQAAAAPRVQPWQNQFQQIRYPHWAKSLSDV